MSSVYEIITPLSDTRVVVSMQVHVNGSEETWRLHLYTLTDFCAEHMENDEVSRQCVDRRHLMYVHDDEHSGRTVTVALSIPVIDPPSVHKAVIMVRNYKQLRPGWHRWGTVAALDRPGESR